jgi:ATP-dependent DNA helicase RecG
LDFFISTNAVCRFAALLRSIAGRLYTVIMITLKTPLKSLPRISEKYAKALKKLGIETVRDLLFHFPFRYDDYSLISPIFQISRGQTVTVEGKIIDCRTTRTWKRKMFLTEALIQDKTGAIRAIWFNQPYLADSIKNGKEIRLSGKISSDEKGLIFSNPAWELASRTPTNTGRLVPVYPETEGLTSKWLRWQIQNLLKINYRIDDPVPEYILKKLNLPAIEKAIRWIHFPESLNHALVAQKRFAFQEMFLVQIRSLSVKVRWSKESAVKIKFGEKLIKDFVETLPFKLTNAQRKSSFEILKDLEKPRPMNRLLNGDVGSGKTVVAAIASLQATSAGYQVAIMAPTEVLAHQHYKSFCNLFKNYAIKIGLVTSAYKKINPEKKTGTKNIHNSKFIIHNSDIVIGTHALIQEDIRFKNLALVIVDEQHRFGVMQRAALQHALQTDADLTQTDTEENEDLLYGELTYQIRGCIYKVKKQLGLGHKENIYQKALEEEFKKNKLSFSKEHSIDINYDGKKIGMYRPDFIIDNKIILELKSLPSIGTIEKKQIWNYLKSSKYKLALLVNFGKYDIKIDRLIHTKTGPHKSASSRRKSAIVPHLLTMTATPIPRTLALAFFGNLDISLLDEMPKDRKKIITRIVGPLERKTTYDFIKQEIKKGRQAFVILPLVEESKILTEVKAAVQEHEKLSREIFPELKLGLIHGRLKSAEKEKVMKDFTEKKVDILVATPVVEVGIDIPNATVMIIEDADRFGLSQLHQFRGRIGRGEHQSHCFLFSSSNSSNVKARLKALVESEDGFKIAERDLELRGPGEFLGTRQSGLPDIAMENLANVKLIQIAREEAQKLLKDDTELKNHPALKDALKKFGKELHLE